MDGKFAIKWKKKFELRQIAKIVFYCGSVFDKEILPLWQTWAFFFTLFDRIIEHKTGDYKHFPFNNSVINQPYTTMLVLDYLRSLWIEKLIEEQQKR